MIYGRPLKVLARLPQGPSKHDQRRDNGTAVAQVSALQVSGDVANRPCFYTDLKNHTVQFLVIIPLRSEITERVKTGPDIKLRHRPLENPPKKKTML